MFVDFLLEDESVLCKADYEERKLLYEKFLALPVEFLSKMRCFQPQIGCLNVCKICSQTANASTEYWKPSRQRNIIAALKYAAIQYQTKKPFLAWDRIEHRVGVIFSYLDNDIGNYFYLDEFVSLVYRELGVKTRISTVGYSRKNTELNDMHKRINTPQILEALGGVRLSFTPYSIGWAAQNSTQYSRADYAKDMANFLSIYKPYYEYAGSGSRNFCVELRYKPLVKICNVYDIELCNHRILCAGNYMYISVKENILFKESRIADPYDHTIKLSQKPEYFYQIDLETPLNSVPEIEVSVEKFFFANPANACQVKVYMLKNSDGIYYSIGPEIETDGNWGINIYPKTQKRNVTGYLITERFFLNALLQYKKMKNIYPLQKFKEATWEDAENVLQLCYDQAESYNMNKEKADYIVKEVIPMLKAYIFALKDAGYDASVFFDPEFTIDTGIICNLGRALTEFKGLTLKENEPLTPTHERNYGKYNSTMTQEGVAWRLSCGYRDTLTIEKLNLYNTASINRPVAYSETLQLAPNNEKLTIFDLKRRYLIPGQKDS